MPDKEILKIVKESFDFRLGMIAINPDLKRGGNGRFLKTAAYGHFQRDDPTSHGNFLGDSTVACTQETFEDGPPKSFLSGQTHHYDIIRRKCLHERSLGSPWPELSSMDEHAAKSSFGYLSYHIGQSFEKINQNTDRDFFISTKEAKEYRFTDGVILNPLKAFPSLAAIADRIKGFL
uniref:Uncharacterized protein n=1 Tax=Vitis vinifera TaxID=29760 RepID=A5API5_VITVI|nr:hypothetical protein VITISV_005166 [Vitis vinifera]